MTSESVGGGVSADFLILADAAQVQGDKLYLLGGGWSMVWAKGFPAQHQMSVAAGILVPWMETNARHRFRVQVRTEEGTSLGEISGEFEQGRPAGMPAGATQRVLLSAGMTVRFERPGEVVVDLWLDDRLAKTVPFRVAERPTR